MASIPLPTSKDTTTRHNMEVITSVSVSESTTANVAASQPTTNQGPTRPNSRSSRCSRMKATGITSNVSNVDVNKPPITVVANGGQTSFSLPLTNASGHSAAMVVAVVINTGRVRSRTVASAAAPADQPPRIRCCIRSTSRIAGFTAKPNNMMAPAKAIMPAGVPVNTSNQVAPSKVSGSDKSTSTGNVKDSNASASTSSNSRIAGNTHACASDACSLSRSMPTA